VKIALAQIDTTIGDFDSNSDRIIKFALSAHERGADLVIFPELALCGYPPRDLVEKPGFVERSQSTLLRLAQSLPPIPALVGYVRRSRADLGKKVANAAAWLEGGKVLVDYAKILLPFYDVFDESRYFEPGDRVAVHDFRGFRVGLTICEDIWNDKNFWADRYYKRDPVEECLAAGANLLLNIASSPYNTEKIQLRYHMLQTIAVKRGIPVAYVNHVGGNDQLLFDGSSMAFNARGELAARAAAFAEDLVIFDTRAGAQETRPEPPSEAEEIYLALCMGLRDYVRKCGFQKVLVGLSGGIDSSLVATLAADALGPPNVLGVGMPGPYSSPGSIRDAETLARNLGIEFRLIPITPVFETYLQTLDAAFGGHPRGVTEENIQARIRGTVLMALSNKFGSLLLTTGNKSELAVGYCTLYGDMAGGLAVIADLPKTTVYALARYINRAAERIPQASLDKPPSAELRPNQTDQDSLPPYEILDAILRAYIEENRSPEEIAATLAQLDLPLVRRTVRMVNAAEYKRQQAPPTLKVTAKAFGMGRRLPIAQKFYE
jgi:NAD+ synthase (glutamine-hydrolysing)